MWWTDRGYQVLRGPEWEVFVAGIDSLWSWIEMEPDDPECCAVGVEVFDKLEVNQKLALLANVGEALHDERMRAPDLTAFTESTVAAVYHHIYVMIESEASDCGEPESGGSDDDNTYWRRLVRAASRAIADDCRNWESVQFFAPPAFLRGRGFNSTPSRHATLSELAEDPSRRLFRSESRSASSSLPSCAPVSFRRQWAARIAAVSCGGRPRSRRN